MHYLQRLNATDAGAEVALGNIMFSCNVTGQDRYCCNDGCSCTEDGLQVNQVVSFSGEPYTQTVIGQTGTYPNPSATPTTTSSASSLSSSTSIKSTTIAPSASAPLSTSSSTSSAASTSSSSSSNAVPIGVGVGVGVGAALILGLGAFFFFRRRSLAQRQQPHMQDKHESLPGYTDNDAHTFQPHKSPAQQDGSNYRPYQGGAAGQVSELPTETTHGRHEMSGGQEVARELPGNTNR